MNSLVDGQLMGRFLNVMRLRSSSRCIKVLKRSSKRPTNERNHRAPQLDGYSGSELDTTSRNDGECLKMTEACGPLISTPAKFNAN